MIFGKTTDIKKGKKSQTKERGKVGEGERNILDLSKQKSIRFVKVSKLTSHARITGDC